MFFTQNVPWLECLAQLQMDTALGHAPERWKAELEMGREPGVLEREPGLTHLGEHVLEVLLDEVR